LFSVSYDGNNILDEDCGEILLHKTAPPLIHHYYIADAQRWTEQLIQWARKMSMSMASSMIMVESQDTISKCSTVGGAVTKGSLPESHGVIFQRVPKELQDVALGGFYATVHFVTQKALGARGHGGYTALDGFFKGGVLAGMNADLGKFKNHWRPRASVKTGEMLWMKDS
jgi:hypothetical protein